MFFFLYRRNNRGRRFKVILSKPIWKKTELHCPLKSITKFWLKSKLKLKKLMARCWRQLLEVNLKILYHQWSYKFCVSCLNWWNLFAERQRCDAVRTDPILLNDDGLALWKLKCFEEEPKFLLQGVKFTELSVYEVFQISFCYSCTDLGTFDDLSPDEKWLAFKPEQKQEIEKYISSNR